MDHCTLPRDPIHSPIKIPHLGFKPAYHPPFARFNELCNWTDDELLLFSSLIIPSVLFTILTLSSSHGYSLAYLRRHTVHCRKAIRQLVNTSTAGEPVINTRCLREHFNELQQAFHNLNTDGKEVYKQQAAAHVTLTCHVLRKQLDQVRRLRSNPGRLPIQVRDRALLLSPSSASAATPPAS